VLANGDHEHRDSSSRRANPQRTVTNGSATTLTKKKKEKKEKENSISQ
jgi:hypothetical protein